MKRLYLAAMLGAATALTAPTFAQDKLAGGFKDPPKSARPNVWWHWMNGNITEEGIAKDLAWMKRIGIGGVQTFDANLLTPPVVPKRLVYMTPEWQKAFRFAARRAGELGLDLSIATSPGWSETGGPWVRAEDGVKKLVWSEAIVAGRKPLSIRLPAPPSISGPFQELPAEGDQLAAMSGEKEFKPPNHYQDVAVFAYRLPNDLPIDQPKAVTAAGKAVDMAALVDDSLMTGADIVRGSVATPTTITIDYARPQTVRSLSFYAVGGAEKFGAPFFLPELEMSDDGETWRKIADLTLTPVPTTIGFAPVKAAHFRVVMRHNTAGGITGFVPAPGADLALILPLFTPKPTIRIARLVLSGEDRVNQFEAKAGYSTVLAYAPLDAERSSASPIAPEQVVDLTARMQPDGTLDWTPPRGRWRVVRLGWSLTGKSNHPAPLEATGLEVDKLDGRAVRNYLMHYLATYKATLGTDQVAKAGLGALLTDSTEVGAFNWTPAMITQFKRLRGYDPTPWLPTLTGAIIGSRAESDGFLYDFRRTIGDLHASEHYGTVAAVAHENGLKVYGEALEDRRPSLGDDLAMRRSSDFPMAALWTYPRGTSPRPTLLGDIKGAASVAHIYGQNVVAAESMTSALQPWGHAPTDLRRVIDLEFLYGVNKPSIHTSVHQPLDTVPGIPLLIFGQYFTRLDTWSEMAKPWIDYIARTSFMLQQGRNHADVAYFYGEDSPLTALYADKPLGDTPRAYAYDFVNADILQNILRPQGTELVASSGARYRVLYLGGTSRRMTLPVLRRIADLVAGGLIVVGEAPTGSPSRKDDPAAFASLAKTLWSGKPTTLVGSGRVIAGTDVEGALRANGLAPDFAYAKPAPDSDVQFAHRVLPDGDVYFINNRQNRAETIEARFRVTGKAPELWRADTGETKPLGYRTENGITVVSLDMAAEDSFFVVFRTPASQPSMAVVAARYAPVAKIDGPWRVAFQPGRGAPASITLPKLAPLNEQDDSGVKYFSGVATYTSTFDLPRESRRGPAMMLQLGQVGDLAEVRINGVPVGTAWHAPYQLDIGRAVRPGRNTIEVKVANLWVNRLIGDAQPGATKITVTTSPTYTARAPLRPSGLIGPVTIQIAEGQRR
jgi:hypothetical protein